MGKTIEYYDSTVNLDMSAQYSMFEKRLYAGAYILDVVLEDMGNLRTAGNSREEKSRMEKHHKRH